MKKSYLTIGIIVIIIVILSCIFLGYTFSEHSSDKTTIEVYDDGYVNMSVFVNEIKTHDYFRGYDNDTLTWLESIDDDYIVLSSNESYYIMSPEDANMIPFEFATDVSIQDTLECEIIDQKSLGSTIRDVCLVKNVEFISKKVTSLDV